MNEKKVIEQIMAVLKEYEGSPKYLVASRIYKVLEIVIREVKDNYEKLFFNSDRDSH